MATAWSAGITKGDKLPTIDTQAVNAGSIEIRADLDYYASQADFLDSLVRLVDLIKRGNHPIGLLG